jgi:signal peptidase I
LFSGFSVFPNAGLIHGKSAIGKIVAFSGVVVEITEAGELIINGSCDSEEVFYPTKPLGTAIRYPYTIPANSVFVMND